MNAKSSWWLVGISTILLVGLIINQVLWVFNSAEQQEAQFNKQIQMALASIENEIDKDQEISESVGCCLVEDENESCSSFIGNDQVWSKTDSMIASELSRFDIDLNYNFDFCFENPGAEETYVQNMDKVFEDSGIILYLEFPDRSKYLRNQIGPVFISSILLIVFLSFMFVLTYRYYKRERNLAQKTRDFINNMTHEFNTPLTNISLANSMIARGVESLPKEKIKHYTGIIEEENARLAKNCEDLLQMARIDNEENEFVETINVHEIITKAIESSKNGSSENNIQFSQDLKAKQFLVLGKESLFYNTITNLVDNAIKYSETDLEITISSSNMGSQICIEITDNGVGIPSKHLNNIFDKFYRVTEGDQHNVKGFGLGLAYVKMVINKMKGSVAAKSKEGVGSTFEINLPIVKTN